MPDRNDQVLIELNKFRESILADPEQLLSDLEPLSQRLKSNHCMPGDRTWITYTNAINSLVSEIHENKVNSEALDKPDSSVTPQSINSLQKSDANGAASAAAVLSNHKNSIVALLRGDCSETALLAYRTAESFPEVAVQVFPTFYFAADARDIVTRSYRELHRTTRSYQELKKANSSKRRKALPTFLVRSLIFAPLSYLLALSRGPMPLPEHFQSRSRRNSSYWGRVHANHEAQLKSFDTKASDGGWAISMNQIQKEMMLLDQVKRLTSIYNNHVLAVSLDAKTKRREIER